MSKMRKQGRYLHWRIPIISSGTGGICRVCWRGNVKAKRSVYLAYLARGDWSWGCQAQGRHDDDDHVGGLVS